MRLGRGGLYWDHSSERRSVAIGRHFQASSELLNAFAHSPQSDSRPWKFARISEDLRRNPFAGVFDLQNSIAAVDM